MAQQASNPGLGQPGSIRPGFVGLPGIAPTIDTLPVLPPYAASGAIQDVRTEMLLGSKGWTDISQWVMEISDQVDSRGKPDESTSNTPGQLTLTLNNADGRFFDGNPTGPYYGQLGRNTQLRISVPEGASYLRQRDDNASYSQTPSASGLNPAGDIDVRLDVTLDNWRSAQQLAAKWAISNQQSWALLISQTGTLTVLISTTGSNTITYASAVPIPVPAGRRQLIRFTYNHTTGAVLLYYGSGSLAGPTWTLADTLAGAGGAIFSSTAALVFGAGNAGLLTGTSIVGKLHAMQLMSGIGGTVVASPDFTVAAPGAATITDQQGNVWTPQGTAIISNRHYRFWGETSAFPTTWNSRGNQVNISLQVSGILRRLTQSNSQQQFNSVLRRAWPTMLPDLVAYWPCEDGNNVTGAAASSLPPGFAPGIPGVPRGTFQGSPQFATDSSFAASLPLPTLNNSVWAFSIPGNHPADVGNIMRFLLHVPRAGEPATFTGGTTQDVPLIELHTSGTIAKLQVALQGSAQPVASGPIETNLVTFAFNSAGTQIGTGGTTIPLQGIPVWCSIEMYQSGGNIQVAIGIQVLGPLGSVVTYVGYLVTGTLGNGTQIVVNSATTLNQTSLGQISYQRQFHDMSLGEFTLPINAWVGETAGNRFQRLCSEQGIPFQSRGNLADTALMGAQTTTNVMALLQECVDADRGMWWEPPWTLALGYRTLADLLNQAPVASIPYAASSLSAGAVASNEDDQFTVNDATVVNSYTGAQAEVIVTKGPLSNQAPPAGVGPYQQTPQINLASDYQCADEASWITWVGTAPDVRFPAVPFPMKRQTTANFFALQEADVGDRIQIITPPANGPAPANTATPVWLPPASQTAYARGGIDVLVNNLATALNVKRYVITITGVPTTPYLCLQADHPVWGHLGNAGSVIDGYTPAADTTIAVQESAGGDLWSAAGGDLPYDIGVAGEQITVTQVTGPGATANSDSANPPQISLTPAATGSIVYGAVVNPTNSTAFTPGAASTFSQNVSDATNTKAYGTFRSTGTTAAGTPVTTGGSAPAVAGLIAVAEVLAAGAIAEDASSPAGVNTLTGKTITTASFTPPAGALILVMVAANGSGAITMTITETGNLGGLRLVATDARNQAQIWAMHATAAPNASTVTATASGANSANGIALTVKVIDNAAAGPTTQVLTCTRAQNGVSKNQASGNAVDLYTIPALSL